MSDILDEVLNDAKHEKRLLLFRKILPLVIAATVIIAIIMAMYNWYYNKKVQHNQKIGELFVQALSENHNNKGGLVTNSLENIITTGDNRQAELADIKLAHNKIAAKKITNALAHLEKVIDNDNYHSITTSYARILWISLILDKKKLSEEQQSKARDYLQYFKDEKQAYYASATLLKAFFYKQNSEIKLAKEYAGKLLGLERASIILKEQARALLASMR